MKYMTTHPVKMGVKETGEAWRDNWRTPQWLLDVINDMWPEGWFDPCPIDWMPEVYNGLTDPWQSKFKHAYINPPFSQYDEWVEHGLKQITECMMDQIWVCHTNNSTGWYKELLAASSGICLLNKRIHFINPITDEPAKSSAYGKSQSLIYIGPNLEQFEFVCRQYDIGPVLTHYRHHKPTPITAEIAYHPDRGWALRTKEEAKTF